MANKILKRKKVGLALGGGGAKGLAHIGVIKVLEENGVPIDFIAGTSMGALVGGWYAATKDIKSLEKIFLKIQKKDIFKAPLMVINHQDYPFKNQWIVDEMFKVIDDKKFEDCLIPFKAIATNAENGNEVILEKGSLVDAVRASTAIPLLLRPIKIHNMLLTDGGFVNNVPADVVRNMGADVVIAVNVSKEWVNFVENSINPRKAISIISGVLESLAYQVAKQKLKYADFILRPAVFNYDTLEFYCAKEIIARGEEEAKNHLEEIQKAVGVYKETPKTFLEKFQDFLTGDE